MATKKKPAKKPPVKKGYTTKEKIIVSLGSITGFLLITIVSVVGWIALQVWHMNPKVSETANRVDRIVDALPDVKIRIAQEDLAKQIRVAIVTTTPEEVSAGKWISAIHVLDYVSGKRKSYNAVLSGRDDYHASYLVTGLASSAHDKLSFLQYAYASCASGKATSVPIYLDGKASYAILKSSVDYPKRLQRLFGKPVKEAALEKRVMQWGQLLKELKKEEADLRPKALSLSHHP